MLEARQLLSPAGWPAAGADGSAPVAVGDFDRDGNRDYAQVNRGYGQGIDGIAVRLDPPESYHSREPNRLLPGTRYDSITTGDFDGDGKLDLAVVRGGRKELGDAGARAVLLGHGDGQVAGWPLLVHDPGTSLMATTDMPSRWAPAATIEQRGSRGQDDYQSSVDWGNGGSWPGVVSTTIWQAPDSTPKFDAFAPGYAYAAAGTYTYTVSVTGRDGETTGQSGTIVVPARTVPPPPDPPPGDPPPTEPPPAPEPIPLTAKLDPASDRGASISDGITNVRQPVFTGTAKPGTVVRIAGVRLDGGPGAIALGSATADGSGNWSLTSVPLADGRYTLGVTAQHPEGSPATPLGLIDIVIDTVAPRVVGASLRTRPGGGLLVFQDDRSGLDPATLRDPATYSLARRPARRRGPVFGAASVTVGEATPDGIRSATLAFKTPGRLRAAAYTLGTLSGAIADLAGNVLDGEYRGTFPSGGTVQPGTGFIALFHVNVRGKASGPLDPTPLLFTPRKRGR
jgi:hypothetical protein